VSIDLVDQVQPDDTITIVRGSSERLLSRAHPCA
jgi:hypothetical protein